MNEKKRYQIFVSSTFEDLKEERGKVMETILNFDCFPAGMELFPAMDEEQFKYIKRIIDESDYYLLIIGGRYGSMDKSGKSWTEKEYEYAVGKGIPIIAFDHIDYTTLPANRTDQDDEKRRKLIAFKETVSTGRLIQKWTDSKDLALGVATSLKRVLELQPRIGWVRANSVISGDEQKEIERLQNEIAKYQYEVKRLEAKTQAEKDRLAKIEEDDTLPKDCCLSENEINKLIAEKNKLTTPDDQLFPIRKNKMWGYMTVTGDIAFMVGTVVDRVFDYHEGLARFVAETKKGEYRGKEGFIDRNGKIIITPQFDDVDDFSNERSIVKLFGSKGVIDKNGNWVIEPRYNYVHRPFPNIFTCSSGYLYDKDGQSIKNEISMKYAYNASEGLLAFKGFDGHDDKWGFIDSNGKIVIEPQYYEIDEYHYFNEGLCAVGSKRHLWGYIDHTGKMAIKRKYQEASYFRNGLAVVKLDSGGCGIINNTGDLIFSTDHRIDKYVSFNQIDFGIIEDGTKYILFDISGNILKSFSSDSLIGYAKYGFVEVKNNEKYGILNSKGEQVISCKYDYIDILSNSLVAVNIDGKWGLIDMSDRIIVKPMYDSIRNYRDGLLSVVKDGKMGYINTIGELIYLE